MFSSQSPETEMLTDKQTKNGQTNGRNYTNFERNLAISEWNCLSFHGRLFVHFSINMLPMIDP